MRFPFGRLSEGDHVLARRDITAGFIDALAGSATIRKGRYGIVRRVDPGLAPVTTIAPMTVATITASTEERPSLFQ